MFRQIALLITEGDEGRRCMKFLAFRAFNELFNPFEKSRIIWTNPHSTLMMKNRGRQEVRRV